MPSPKDLESPKNLESVWDYPRPPALESVTERVRVVFAGETIADTNEAQRVLETSHPPVYYLPPGDVRTELLKRERRTSLCEFKGRAAYYTLSVEGRVAEQAAWSYADPVERYAALAGHFAFYLSKVDAGYVGDEQAHPQDGDFYGGWITSRVEGPFKGGPGTIGW